MASQSPIVTSSMLWDFDAVMVRTPASVCRWMKRNTCLRKKCSNNSVPLLFCCFVSFLYREAGKDRNTIGNVEDFAATATQVVKDSSFHHVVNKAIHDMIGTSLSTTDAGGHKVFHMDVEVGCFFNALPKKKEMTKHCDALHKTRHTLTKTNEKEIGGDKVIIPPSHFWGHFVFFFHV